MESADPVLTKPRKGTTTMFMRSLKRACAFALAALAALTYAADNGKAIEFHNAFEAPFELTGFPWRGPNGELRRLPMTITEKDLGSALAARAHAWQSAGGEVRFRTSSDRVVLRAELYYVFDMNHMARTGSAGFAFYTDSRPGAGYDKFQRVVGLSAAEAKNGTGAEGSGKLEYTLYLNNGGKPRTVSIYMPLYSAVRKMEIGLEEGSQLLPPLPRKIKDPICFYGSSITQGCSASHPGNAYTTMLCRALDAPQINLGFSDGARGEQCVAEAIAGLKLSAFVMDYDHNAKSLKQLKETHEKFFKTIRAAQPDLPIIVVSGPRDGRVKDYRDRRDVIRQTVANALKAGDKHVYFVDGIHFYDQKGMPVIVRDYTTVDNTHPTDLGMQLMFRRILPELQKALAEAK